MGTAVVAESEVHEKIDSERLQGVVGAVVGRDGRVGERRPEGAGRRRETSDWAWTGHPLGTGGRLLSRVSSTRPIRSASRPMTTALRPRRTQPDSIHRLSSLARLSFSTRSSPPSLRPQPLISYSIAPYQCPTTSLHLVLILLPVLLQHTRLANGQ